VNTDPVSSEAFSETQEEDLQLVTDLSWFNPIPEDELVEMVEKVLEKNIFLDRGRKEMIIEGIVRNRNVVAKLKNDLELF
jgi:predicted nucleic-acid-binding protein